MEIHKHSGSLAGVERTCPVCDAVAALHQLVFTEGEWRVVRCGNCGMVFLANPPGYKALADKYAWEVCYAQETVARREREPWLHAFQDAIRGLRSCLRSRNKLLSLCRRYLNAGVILDVGCRTARRMQNLIMKHGFDITPYGIEIDPKCAAIANAQFRPHGGQAEATPAIEGLAAWPEASFDGALLRAYLEHESQPKAAMIRLNAALKPGGFIVIKVPNHASLNRYFRGRRWCGYRLPDHVCYFTPATLTRVVTDTGFQIERFGFADRIPISDNMWLVARKPRS